MRKIDDFFTKYHNIITTERTEALWKKIEKYGMISVRRKTPCGVKAVGRLDATAETEKNRIGIYLEYRDMRRTENVRGRKQSAGF